MADVLKSFDVQKTLNPVVWLNADSNNVASIRLVPAIRQRLIAIAKAFIDTFKLKNINIEDVIFTGSLANYNWSEYSDIDLHVILDKSAINIDPDVLEDYFAIKKDTFNTRHDIKIKGFDVEVYAQDSEEDLTALGIYSVLSDEWLKFPIKDNVVIDKLSIRKKVKEFIEQIQKIDYMIHKEENPEEIIAMIQTLKDKIKKYRKSGLAANGEYSDENLVFKYLRRTKYLQKLSDYKIQTIDRMFSLQEVE